MMSECLDCGQSVAFNHEVEGTETRIYDGEGYLDSVEHQQLETRDCWCDECGSHNVEFH
jgi:hypothetical protein